MRHYINYVISRHLDMDNPTWWTVLILAVMLCAGSGALLALAVLIDRLFY